MSTTIGLSFNIKLLSQKVWSLILETACRTLDLHDSWTIDVTASSLFLSCLLPHLYGSRTKCNDAERSIITAARFGSTRASYERDRDTFPPSPSPAVPVLPSLSAHLPLATSSFLFVAISRFNYATKMTEDGSNDEKTKPTETFPVSASLFIHICPFIFTPLPFPLSSLSPQSIIP